MNCPALTPRCARCWPENRRESKIRFLSPADIRLRKPVLTARAAEKKMRAQARQTLASLSFRCASRQARPPKAGNGFRKIRLALRYRWISGLILPPSRAGETRHKLLHYRSRHRADGSPTPFFMRWPVLPVALDGSAARSRHWQALDARRTLDRM